MPNNKDPKPSETINLRTVAEKAGVGLGTASRAMNRNLSVRRDTLEKVWKAAKELGYDFPEAERRPSHGNTTLHEKLLEHGCIALILPDRNPDGLKTELSKELTAGIEAYLYDRKIRFVTATFKEDGSLPDCLADRTVDGYILRGDLEEVSKNDQVRELADRFTHVSVLWHDSDDSRDSILSDSEREGRMVADFFKQRKRKRVAVVSAFEHRTVFSAATFGFLDQARRIGIEATAATRFHAKENEEELQVILKEFLQKTPDPDGLLFVGGHPIWQPVLKASGITPENCDVVLAGIPTEEVAQPLLDAGYHATISHPARIGRAAAEQLLWRIVNPQARSRRILIPPDLKVAGH